MTDSKRVVVVGGGIAGMELASRLGRASRRMLSLQVKLIDKSLSHVWKPALHTVAAGTSRLDQERLSFFAQAERCGFEFCPGTLVGVDRSAKHVVVAPFGNRPPGSLKEIQAFPYDVLVLAIGSRANSFGIRGVEENCLFIDDLADADRFHSELRDRLFKAMTGDARLEIAIVGGGATVVELVAELKRVDDILRGYKSHGLRSAFQLTLIESGARLLTEFPDSISNRLLKNPLAVGVIA